MTIRDNKGRFVKGYNNIKGKKHSNETKEKMRLSHLGKSPSNKGRWSGKWTKDKGYLYRRCNGKIISQHHYVWLIESEWGFIPKGFVVHHKNGIRDDNRIENLACIPRDYHTKLHNELELLNNPNRKYWGINRKGD